MQKNIVILGGGFGGLRTAIELSRMPEVTREHHIILVDRNTSHLFTPLLYEVASVLLQKETPAEEFCMRNGVCVDFGFLQRVAMRDRVEFIQGEVTGLDSKKQEVILGKQRIPYVHCIVAFGSATNDFGIPGVQKYGHTFKWMQDALTIHTRVLELLQRKQDGKERTVSIVVGGGGPAGVELAAELSEFCMHACARYSLRFSDFHITLVEAGNRLLGALPPTIGAWALERLQHLGIEVWRDTCVKEVKKEVAVIAPRPLHENETVESLVCDFRGDHEKEIESDIFIWSGGVAAPDVLQKCGLLLDAKGRVDVHDTLLANGFANIFALGDCAALLDPHTNRTVPGLAQVAIFEAQVVAENIRRSIVGKHLHSYTYPFIAHLVPIGGKYALGDFGPLYLKGSLMWFLRRLVDFKYFLSIMPFQYALKTWWDGWKMYTKND